MATPKQVFVAPGPEDEPLPGAPSPWLDGRRVRIPLAYWYLLTDRAETLESGAAKRLLLHSGSYSGDDTMTVDERSLLTLLARLADDLRSAPDLLPEPTDEYPDPYPNTELARMVCNVREVLAEAERRGEPYRAWNE